MGLSGVRPRRLLEPEFWEVIQAMGPKAETLEWRIGEHAEGNGPAEPAGRLFGWGDSGQWVPGKAFVAVAVEGVELWGGKVSARRAGAKSAAVTMRPFAGKGWQVEADDPSLVRDLREAFPGAVSLKTGGFRIPHGSRRSRPDDGGGKEVEAARSNLPDVPDPLDELFGGKAPGREGGH